MWDVNRYSDGVLRENIGMTIGMRIKASRERASLTQPQLAKAVGMSQSALSELESGASKTTGKLAAIAKECGVNAYWLETGKGSMIPELAPAATATNVTRLERLDAEESELIQNFRKSSRAKRMTILAAADADEALGAESGADVTGH